MRNKGMRPSFSFMDVEPEEHAVSYSVAKVMELDLLEAIRGEVQKALDQGLPFAAFKKNFRNNPALTEWWGKKEMVDPLTGATELVQLGSPRRLRTIYNANIRSARAAGQWERIERTKDAFPYLEYRLGPSERHRPHHADKLGMILPVDSPFWDEWMPPNGWGCKCWVRQVTRREGERRGVSSTPDVPDRIWINQRTGENRIIPQGIDPGWQRNPGKLRLQAMEGILNEKIAALPPEVARVALRDIATSWRVDRIMAGGFGSAPVALMPNAAQVASAASSPIVSVSAESKLHLVDQKLVMGQPSRAPFLLHLDRLPDATDAFLERRADGKQSLHLYVRDMFDPKTPTGLRRGFYVVIWFDPLPRIRTIFPKAELSYWEKQAARDGAIPIILK